ncbi:hypothetical protein K7432_014776 [Basidiobolus ranarum]|uniref:Peptidase A1 domain-containing protein n=1 Tax=Basidiobolus ranarum TaxID=34480 RepID=A0ABR2WH68_9FUNG
MEKLLVLVLALTLVHPTIGVVIPRSYSSNGVYTLPIRRSTVLPPDTHHSRSLKARAVGSIPAKNMLVHYSTFIEIGSPPTSYEVLIDTNSANTWVGAGKAYVRTSTSEQTSNSVSVNYGSSSFSGTEFTDTVTMGPNLVIQKQSIGVASTSQGFSGLDGVLGLGPAGLTLGTLSPDSASIIPTVVDNLFSQKTIPSDIFSIYFEPATAEAQVNGEIIFGGTDSSKYTGNIIYAPITTTSPANQSWAIDGSIRYGSTTAIMSNTPGIIDSGTSLVLLPTEAFQSFMQATGATMDQATGLPTLTTAQFDALQSLFITIGSTTLELTANACIIPRSMNTQVGGNAGDIYLAFGDQGTKSGQGPTFTLGLAFLERFYTVYDTANKRIGLATTAFTRATSN